MVHGKCPPSSSASNLKSIGVSQASLRVSARLELTSVKGGGFSDLAKGLGYNFSMNLSTPARAIPKCLLASAVSCLCLSFTAFFLPVQAEPSEWEKLNEQGLQDFKDNNLDQAEASFKQAEEDLTQRGHQEANLATVKNHLGELYEKQGKLQEAENYYKEAIELRQESIGGDHPLTARTMINLARLYEKEGKNEGASQQYANAQGIMEKSLGGDHPTIGTTANIIDWAASGIDKDEKVPPHVTKEANRIEKNQGEGHPDAGNKLNAMGDFYRAHGQFDQAEELYKRSTNVDSETLPTDPTAAKRYTDMATMYQHQGRMDEAEKYFQRAGAILDKSEDIGLDNRGTTLNKMANFYEAKGDNETAEKYYKGALEAREQFSEEKQLLDNKGVEKPVAETLTDYAKFLHKIGKDEAADKLDTRAHDILDSLKP